VFGNDSIGCDEDTAREIAARYFDAGGWMIDVADFYVDGRAEEIVGRVVAGRRDQVLIATKVGMSRKPGPLNRGLSRKHILTALDASLRRLGTDYIDLYQLHSVDLTTPIEETLSALSDCVHAGKVRYIGCSNFEAWRLMKSLAVSDAARLERICALQAQYSLLCRDIEREHVPLCLSEGVGVLGWGPLAAGMLTGKVQRRTAPPPGSRLAVVDRHADRIRAESNLSVVDALIEVARREGCSPPQAALAWTIRQPSLASVIVGARTAAQVEDNLGSLAVALSDGSIRQLLDATASAPTYPYDYLPSLDEFIVPGRQASRAAGLGRARGRQPTTTLPCPPTGTGRP
jgi:aryl-alcohol dehydrogenase-like predicted oxidoreductase